MFNTNSKSDPMNLWVTLRDGIQNPPNELSSELGKEGVELQESHNEPLDGLQICIKSSLQVPR
jgi:hypothetical protein